MALATENLVLVKQRAEIALRNANPCIQAQFRDFISYVAGHKPGTDLQLVSFGDALLVTSTGYTPVAAAGTLYAVYFKKNGTGTGTATDSWLTIANDTSNTTDATKFVALMTSVADQEVTAFYPNGLIFGTDITLTGETSAQDGTESSGGDSGTGFIIIGS